VAAKPKKKSHKKNPCEKCTGLCCRYFALPIDDPEDWDDYDDIRWFLCHEDITVFVEDGDWYLNVKNKCKHLSGNDHRCEIYDKRPKICRGYEIDTCDFTGNDYDHELYFKDDKQMEEYMKIKFGDNVLEKLKPKNKRKRKSKKR